MRNETHPVPCQLIFAESSCESKFRAGTLPFCLRSYNGIGVLHSAANPEELHKGLKRFLFRAHREERALTLEECTQLFNVAKKPHMRDCILFGIAARAERKAQRLVNETANKPRTSRAQPHLQQPQQPVDPWPAAAGARQVSEELNRPPRRPRGTPAQAARDSLTVSKTHYDDLKARLKNVEEALWKAHGDSAAMRAEAEETKKKAEESLRKGRAEAEEAKKKAEETKQAAEASKKRERPSTDESANYGGIEGSGASTLDAFVGAVMAKASKAKLLHLSESSKTALLDVVNALCYTHASEGRTPLAYAVQINSEKVARDLISIGANVNLLMGGVTTALTLAVTNKRKDGTAMVRLLLSKGADPAALGRAGIEKRELNCTMRYWIERAEGTRHPSPAELKHLAKTPPMERIHEIDYAVIGQGIAVEMMKRALRSRFGNPAARKKPLVLLLLGPPGHGKTCISRNLAKSLVGDENFIEVACGGLRDDADLFGSRLGGSRRGDYSSDGRLTGFLRARQSTDTIVFLDEFEKIKGLTSALGWDQAKKMYQAFLEPWQEGTLTDAGAASKQAKVDCARTVWILTSNWGQTEILDFAEEHADRVHKKMDDNDLEWVKRELIEKKLNDVVMRQFRGVDAEVQALARRIDFTVPFLPFTEQERKVVADTEVRHHFQQYREPAVLDEEPDESKRRLYGNLHLQHSLQFCEYAAERYKPMEGADSMTRVAHDVDGKFLSSVLEHRLELSEPQRRRMCSNRAACKSEPGYASEPQFWVHYCGNSEQIKILQHAPASAVDQAEQEDVRKQNASVTAGSRQDVACAQDEPATSHQNPFDSD